MEIKQAFLDRVIHPLQVDENWMTFFEQLVNFVDFSVTDYLKAGNIPIKFTVPLNSVGLEFVVGNYYKVKLALPSATYTIESTGWVFVSEDVESTSVDYVTGTDLFIRFLGETPETDAVSFEIKEYPTNFGFSIDDGLPIQFAPGSYYNVFFAAALCKAHLVFPFSPKEKEYKLRSEGTDAVQEIDSYHYFVPSLDVPPHVGVAYDKLKVYHNGLGTEFVIKSIDGGLISLMQENTLSGESGLTYSLVRTYDSFLLNESPAYINAIVENLDSVVKEFIEESVLATNECDVTLYQDYYLDRVAANIAMSTVGGTVSTGVTTNGTLLVANLPDWLTYDSLNNTFTMGALPSEVYYRVETIDFIVREKPTLHTTVIVGQYNYYVTFEKPVVEINALAQEVDPGMLTNGTIVLEEPVGPDAWLTYDATEKKFAVTQNQSVIEQREVIVICGIEESGATGSFKIIQDKLFYLNLSRNSDSVTNLSGTKKFRVTTNDEITIKSDSSWAMATIELLSADSYGRKEYEVTVTYEENVPAGAQRVAKVTVTASSAYISKQVYTLTQAASVANYSIVTVNLSYLKALPAGGVINPNLAYSQTWGWNDSITDAGTITFGAAIEYAIMVIDPETGAPSPVTSTEVASIDSLTGVLTWNPNYNTANARTLSIGINILLNGKRPFGCTEANPWKIFTASQEQDGWEYNEYYNPAITLSSAQYNFTELGGSLDVATLLSCSQEFDYIMKSGASERRTVVPSATWTFVLDNSIEGLSLSGSTVTADNNRSTSAKETLLVHIYCNANGKSSDKVLKITQSAGYKTYSAIQLQASYPIAVPSALSSIPVYSYIQTWGWNGATSGGGTLTSGAQIVFSAVTLPTGVTLDTASGSVLWPGPNEGAAITATVKIKVTMNGKSAENNLTAVHDADEFSHFTYGEVVVTTTNKSIDEQEHTEDLTQRVTYSQVRTSYYKSGKTTTDTITSGAALSFKLNGSDIISPKTFSENKTLSTKTFDITVTVNLNGKTTTKSFTISQSAGYKTYSAISASLSYARIEPSELVANPMKGYSQTWGWNGATSGGGTLTSGATIAFSAASLPQGTTLNTSTGVVTFDSPNEGGLEEITIVMSVSMNGTQATVSAVVSRGADEITGYGYSDISVDTVDITVDSLSHNVGLLNGVTYSQVITTYYKSGKTTTSTVSSGATVTFTKISGALLTISGTTAIIAENQSLVARDASLQVLVELNGKSATDTININQSAGYKSYSEITASLSYPDAKLIGDTITPSYSYQQTWGWNGATSGGGTLTSGAAVSFSSDNLPSDVTLNDDTGVISWGAVSSERSVTVDMLVESNGKQKTVSTTAKQSSATIVSQETQYDYTVSLDSLSSFPAKGATKSLTYTGFYRTRTKFNWSDGTTTYSSWGSWTVTTVNLSFVGSHDGFSLSGRSLTAANRSKTTGSSRTCTVRATNSLNSSTYVDRTYTQLSNGITYGSITHNYHFASDIPASGGSISSGTVYGPFYQSVVYDSEETDSISVSPSITYGTAVTASSRGRVIGSRVFVDYLKANLVANDITSSFYIPIYQAANSATSSISWAGAPTLEDIPASGGTVYGSDANVSGWSLTENITYSSGATDTNTTISISSDDHVTASNLGTTITSRALKGTVDIVCTGNYSSRTYTAQVCQEANTASYGALDFTSGGFTVADIPASGGTRTAADVTTTGTIKQAVTYKSGSSTTVAVSPTISSYGSSTVTASSRGTTVGARKSVGTLTFTATANSYIEIQQLTVYQAENKVESATLEHAGSFHYSDIPASGGTMSATSVDTSDVSVVEILTYSSTSTETKNVAAAYSSTNEVTAESLGKTIKSRASVGTLYLKIQGSYSSKTVDLTIYQAANSVVWGSIYYDSNSAIYTDDFPAAAASNWSVASYLHYDSNGWKQYKNYTSGDSESVVISPSFDGAEISTTSLETTLTSRTLLGTYNFNASANGQTYSGTVSVYREANTRSVSSVNVGFLGWSCDSYTMTAAGGSQTLTILQLSLQVTYRYTSGSTASQNEDAISSSYSAAASGTGFSVTKSRNVLTAKFASRGTIEGEARTGSIILSGVYGGVSWSYVPSGMTFTQEANTATWVGGSFSITDSATYIPAAGGSKTYAVTKPTAISFSSGASITSGITVEVSFDGTYTGFSLSNTSGSGTLTAAENTGSSIRTCTVQCHAYCGTRSTRLGSGTIVYQEGTAEGQTLSIVPTSQRATLSVFTITVTASAYWTAKATSGIDLSVYSGSSGTTAVAVYNSGNTTGFVRFYISSTLVATCTIYAGLNPGPIDL